MIRGFSFVVAKGLKDFTPILQMQSPPDVGTKTKKKHSAEEAEEQAKLALVVSLDMAETETEAERYRALAEEAFIAADRLSDRNAQHAMRQLALGYYRLAILAEESIRNRSWKPPSFGIPETV